MQEKIRPYFHPPVLTMGLHSAPAKRRATANTTHHSALLNGYRGVKSSHD
ncbi:hypothetical protein [Nostoc sp. CMAA1605]|nr:hypothetical protein [Nostoc sp. CMAA1605]